MVESVVDMSHCKHKWETPEAYSYFKDPMIKCTICGKTSFPNKTANAKARLGLGGKVTNKKALTGFGKCKADLSYSTVEHNKQYHNHKRS